MRIMFGISGTEVLLASYCISATDLHQFKTFDTTEQDLPLSLSELGHNWFLYQIAHLLLTIKYFVDQLKWAQSLDDHWCFLVIW